jgi:hypothetical protein
VRVIIRENPDGALLLVRQIDHAALASRILGRWRRDGFPDSPRRDVVLLAALRHDDGWIEDDREPIVDVQSGEVLDYVRAPDEIRRAIWPRGVAALRSFPYAAALVARHALHIFERYRADPEWRGFFDEMERLRQEQLRHAAPRTAEELEHDYFFVRMADLLSLQFCDDWLEPQRLGEYESRWDGQRLTIEPDPFDGESVRLSVPARRLPARTFADGQVAAAAYATAAAVSVTGVATGSRP